MKKVIILVLVAGVLLLFTACSSEDSNGGEGNNQPNESESNKDENNDTQTTSTEKEAEKAGPFDPNGNIGDFLGGDYDPTAIHPIDTNWTRQSRFAGPQKPEVLWSLEIVEKYTGDPEKSIPVIGADGTIYIVTNMHDEEADGLYAIASDGELKWKSTNFHEELDMHAGDYQRPAPAITADGDIWVHLNNDLFALFDGDNGDLKDSFAWETNLGVPADPFVLGADDTFYIDNGGMLGSLKSDESVNWELGDTSNDSEYLFYGHPAVASDDTVYGIEEEAFYALDEKGDIKWEDDIDTFTAYSNIQIDKDGNVYFVLDNNIVSYSKDGEKRWEQDVESDYTGEYGGLILTNDGNLISLFENGLHAVDLDGNEQWHYQSEEMGYSDIIADSEGTVYFRSWDEIYAVDSSGELKWNFRPEKASEFSNMVLAPDRTLYLFDNTGTVYAIGEE